MEEHKLLTGMLLVALVVSVVGTVITFDRLGTLGVASNSDGGFTGAITGNANLTITVDTTISLPTSSVSFGIGVIDTNTTFATYDGLPGVWDSANFTNASYNITVRNDGNVDVNVTIQSNVSRGNASGENGDYSFACSGAANNNSCGIGLANNSGVELRWAYLSVGNEAGSCAPNYMPTGIQEFNNQGTDYKFCGCLDTGASTDEAAALFEIGLPLDATGVKEATITFTAVQSDVTC